MRKWVECAYFVTREHMRPIRETRIPTSGFFGDSPDTWLPLMRQKDKKTGRLECNFWRTSHSMEPLIALLKPLPQHQRHVRLFGERVRRQSSRGQCMSSGSGASSFLGKLVVCIDRWIR